MKFESPKVTPEVANENESQLEKLEAQVEELKTELFAYHCPPESDRVLSKEENETAKELSRQLHGVEEELQHAKDAIHAKRSTFYREPPEGYFGNPIIVTSEDTQDLSPAASDNRPPTPDIAEHREAA